MDDELRRYTTGLIATLGLYLSYRAYAWINRPTHLASLPGPESPNWLWGHMGKIMEADPCVLHEEWVRQYGPVVAYRGLLNRRRLVTTDLRAIQHILTRSDIFEKPKEVQRGLSRILGAGVLVAEGDAHRKQRRVLNPAFGPGQVRELTGIFLDKANEMRNVIVAGNYPIATSGQAQMDIIPYLSRTTLDIIGLAGFGYSFDALSSSEKEPNELAEAFKTLFRVTQAGGLVDALHFLLPVLRYLPFERNTRTEHARAVMDRIGLMLINERKAAISQGSKSNLGDRDLLSLLVRANTAADPSQRLSDQDVLAQIPTFLTAGHETTSTAVAWTLYALSLRSDIQDQLRAELRAYRLPTSSTGNAALTAEEVFALEKLPFLDAVVRETLRLHCPVPSTIRAATQDDVIPLSRSFIDIHGGEQKSFRVSKGDPLFIPIIMINRSTELWGEDAHDWRPERWLENRVPEAVRDVPGVWGNLLTFLGGPHSCIGYRFSLLETKILLHVLISAFEFRLAVDPAEIGKKSGAVTRPVLKGKEKEGARLPLLVKAVGEGSEGL